MFEQAYKDRWDPHRELDHVSLFQGLIDTLTSKGQTFRTPQLPYNIESIKEKEQKSLVV